jgi:hypothetical protein
MGVLMILLAVLLNLGFGETQTPSDTPSGAVDVLVEQYRKAIEEARKQYGIERGAMCSTVNQEVYAIASKYKWLRLEGDNKFIELPDPKGLFLYQVQKCSIAVHQVKGTLSPPSPSSLNRMPEGILTKQDVKFGVDVDLFKVLFQLLLYGAGIFWLVRVARKFIEGDLSETFVAFAQGFLIVAVMYVLYRFM